MSITRDINLISAEDLKLFTDLSQPIVDAVIAWRNQQPIVDLEELKKITGITDLELEVIRGVGFKAADKNQATDHLPPPTLSIPNMRLVQDVMIPVSQTISVPALNQPNPFFFQPLAGDGSRSLFQERRNNERDQRDEEEGVDNGNTAPSAPIIPDTQGASAISLPVKLKDGSEVIALQIPPCYYLTAWILLGGSGDGDGQGASAL
ncbi:MAG: hypothetical protein H0V39_05800, partial [Nitrosomonas sp.]|nr:hypothetical protein [Nitrosomonas sp.]